MGSTIRRTPVNYKIPAKPKYKFSNIVDFGGLQITDNPLIAPTNTASDMLNVYVDETNALTTRPRLEKKYDYTTSETLSGKQILKVYPLVDGFLIHCKSGISEESATYSLYIHREDTISAVSDSDSLTPINTFSCFEDNSIIYIIDGVNYLQIKNNVLSAVEGYIPTAKISVKKYDTETGNAYYEDGVDYESLNLMSDKYAQLFFWDGVSEINYPTDNLLDEENEYFKQSTTSGESVIGIGDDKTITAVNSNGSLVYYIYNKTNYSWDKKTTNLDVSNYTMRMAKNTNLLIGYISTVSGDSNAFCYIEFDFVLNQYKTLREFDNSPQSSLNLGVDSMYMNLSDDGKVLGLGNVDYYVKIDPNNYHNSSLTKIWRNSGSDSTYYAMTSRYYNTYYFTGTDNYMICAGTNGHSDTIRINIYKNDYLTDESTSTNLVALWKYINVTIDYTITNRNQYTVIRAAMLDLNTVFVSDASGFWLYDISGEQASLKTAVKFRGATGYSIDRENSKLILYNVSNNGTEVRVYDLSNPSEFYSTICFLPIEITKADFYTDKIPFYTTLRTIILCHGAKLPSSGVNPTEAESISLCKFVTNLYQESAEPKLKVIYKNQNLSELYIKWLERRTKFLNSTLTKRWNNEQWFASGNTLFRTVNNDPTYIGLTSFTELGDSEEPITGFNIAQDNLFLVYKNGRIYAVQYGEVLEDTYDYLYTETKNNVGNDAPGNCIVSVLTEMPLQVSYDGIYALNQLKDVATSDRVCMPISENINPRWLKETKQAISNCITLNRLYWTYFILTYRKTDYTNYDREFDFVGTKVYLLDNRNGQWYYWELPIITTNAFSKDNETHFVDEDGKLYVLKTTDIINKYNNEVTEYYDDGEKLIPWKWTSQIMPLGTINYSKRLIDTTFILTDTDTVDEYGLMYKFRSFRKMASQTGENTISNKLNYIQSVTKKTLIPRCNFIQLELSNIDEDLNNNKLRLVGLGFRYVLLEGLY